MYTGYPKNAQVHVWVTGVIRQAYLETTRLIGCLTPVGITDEVVHSCWEGCSCSASCVSDADGC